MNIEDITKISIVILTFLVVTIFTLGTFFYNINPLFAFISLYFGLLLLIIIEMYIGIQHNIDDKGLRKKAVKRFNEKITVNRNRIAELDTKMQKLFSKTVDVLQGQKEDLKEIKNKL